MKAGGSIILTGSTTEMKETSAFSIYKAGKAAVPRFARSWSLTSSTVVLSPGATSMPGLHGLSDTLEEKEALVADLVAQTPLGRLGRPEKTAVVALFLPSDDSSFMNGAEVFVDGGAVQS